MSLDTVKKLRAVSTFLILVSLAISGCTTPATVINADASRSAKALAFDVPPDRGRIYFVSGSVKENLFGLKHRYPSNFFVDGENIGSKNPENVLVFDVKPGRYELKWTVRSTDPVDKSATADPFYAAVPGGGSVIVRGDYSVGGALLLGLLGSVIAPPRSYLVEGSRGDVAERNVVLPQSCPPTICLP